MIQTILEHFVKQYFKNHPTIKLIVVAGSVGKTSTKHAIATLLSQKFIVSMQAGNHNTHTSAPLAILGIEYPDNVKSLGSWLRVFREARQKIRQPSTTDVIIQEIGADHPGDIAQFGRYLRPYIGVVTAVTPEHMEFFKSMDAVAREELTAANFSDFAFINHDDVSSSYAHLLTNPQSRMYGTSDAAEYRFEIVRFTDSAGYEGRIVTPEHDPFPVAVRVIGEHSLRPVVGAAAVALKMGMSPSEIAQGLINIKAVPGRMNLLHGPMDSIIIDDSYNSSPVAVSAALQSLYSISAPQRIAILGDMNELGDSAPREHETVGKLCDPVLLSWVVTIGPLSEKYLAPAARARGCQVRSFQSAIDAGAFVRSVLERNSAVLAKGSQGNIYTEEAVKVLAVLDTGDELVRQSPQWLKRKSDFFSKF